MAHRTGRAQANRNHQKHPLAPNAADSHALPCSDSDTSSGESARLSGLAASFRIALESLLRMEQTELEMAKAREALRLKAENRRLEPEAELTQMLLQIASLASRRSSRKRSEVRRKKKRKKTWSRLIRGKELWP